MARADCQGGGREPQISSQMRVICCIVLLDVLQQYRLIEDHATKSVEDIKFHMCTEKVAKLEQIRGECTCLLGA